ncbi:MAG: amino acid permease, partial [Candidatus Sumerlaeota bacterium]
MIDSKDTTAAIASPPPATGYGFGTFKGVFTPSILTILGVIMYLRFGWVLGNVGIIKTLLIVVIACTITGATALSISALATNTRVGAGGAYWIISRTLGLEAGAAIGLPLFFAKAFGISFYVAGFAESVVLLYPAMSVKLIAISTLFILAGLALISAEVALRTQFFILIAIALSLISFFMGSPIAEVAPTATIGGFAKVGFWAAFAVFFPAVTGIEAGLDMSGDLKNASKSLPRGTLLALLVSLVIYIAIPILLHRWVPNRDILVADSMIMVKVARWGPLVIAGIWGATLSSALSSILGAPRLMQALARDGILPQFLGRGYGHGHDPRIATAASCALALVGVLVGDLNVIAHILSMFFLTSYGILNACATFESLVASPSWRPSFRIPWLLPLFGTLGCAGTMFMIDPGATIIAFLVTGAIYWFIKRREMRARWGDMRYGLLMAVSRQLIYSLDRKHVDPRNWAPNVLVLTGHPKERWHLLEIADALARRNGFLTVAAVSAESDGNSVSVENIRQTLFESGVDAVAKVIPAPDYLEGAVSLLDSYGFGPLTPNTLLLGLSGRDERREGFCELLQHAHRVRKNVVVVREGKRSEKKMEIDIWWGGQTRNAGLMLVLAFCLRRTSEWGRAKIVIKTIAPPENVKLRTRDLEKFA